MVDNWLQALQADLDKEGLVVVSKKRVEALEGIADYSEHTKKCILSFLEAGEPTPDGGYRTRFAGKWYQSRPINEEPKCNCGLEDLYKLKEDGGSK